MMGTDFKGNQFGVRFESRSDNDNRVCIQLLGEDDEHWFEIGNTFSSFWLDDLISVLQTARAHLNDEQHFHRPDRWGWAFKRRS